MRPQVPQNTVIKVLIVKALDKCLMQNMSPTCEISVLVNSTDAIGPLIYDYIDVCLEAMWISINT